MAEMATFLYCILYQFKSPIAVRSASKTYKYKGSGDYYKNNYIILI